MLRLTVLGALAIAIGGVTYWLLRRVVVQKGLRSAEEVQAQLWKFKDDLAEGLKL